MFLPKDNDFQSRSVNFVQFPKPTVRYLGMSFRNFEFLFLSVQRIGSVDIRFSVI